MDFKRIMPDMFRGDEQALTTDASGYIYLPINSFEVEAIVITSNKDPLEPMSKRLKNIATGWYHDGAQTSGSGIGKRRIMIRKDGVAWPSLAVTVDLLIEFPELTTLAGIPYPFVQQRYLNMLTELQSFMLYMEGGKEAETSAAKHWKMYQFLLEQVKKDSLSKLPEFMAFAHSDAGDSRAVPLIQS